MNAFLDNFTSFRSRSWQWFSSHAQGKHALPWLAVIAFTDTIISPLAPEIFLVALMLAHPKRWREYLPVSIAFSTLGAIVGFFLASFLFTQFGDPILNFYGLERGFNTARHLLVGHVFLMMALASFTPLPDKVFIYAAGFLGVHFWPFILGFFFGRSIRMALVCYLTERFGKHILDIIDRYVVWFFGVVLALLAIYGIVHWHLLPW